MKILSFIWCHSFSVIHLVDYLLYLFCCFSFARNLCCDLFPYKLFLRLVRLSYTHHTGGIPIIHPHFRFFPLLDCTFAKEIICEDIVTYFSTYELLYCFYCHLLIVVLKCAVVSSHSIDPIIDLIQYTI